MRKLWDQLNMSIIAKNLKPESWSLFSEKLVVSILIPMKKYSFTNYWIRFINHLKNIASVAKKKKNVASPTFLRKQRLFENKHSLKLISYILQVWSAWRFLSQTFLTLKYIRVKNRLKPARNTQPNETQVYLKKLAGIIWNVIHIN